MKREEGITLVSLVTYIIVMIAVLGIISGISRIFYGNTQKLDERTKDVIRVNDFNSYFVSEIKSVGNEIDTISEDGTYILFKSGNSFKINNNIIYFNDTRVCDGVKKLEFKKYIDSEGKESKDIVTVNIEFENYSRQVNYKIEEIY